MHKCKIPKEDKKGHTLNESASNPPPVVVVVVPDANKLS